MNISLSTANGSSSSMSQILVSMSLYLVITVVNSSNTATDISGHSKQAQESQVNVIPSYKLKHTRPAPGPRSLRVPAIQALPAEHLSQAAPTDTNDISDGPTGSGPHPDSPNLNSRRVGRRRRRARGPGVPHIQVRLVIRVPPPRRHPAAGGAAPVGAGGGAA